MDKCPVCHSDAARFAGKEDRLSQRYEYWRCHSCGLLFEKDFAENPAALETKISKLYGGEYFTHTDSGWKERGDRVARVVSGFLRMGKNASVLDYGAGNGYVTANIKNASLVRYYDKYEKPTYPGNYQILETPEKSDVVLAVELVEHVTSIAAWDEFNRLAGSAFIFTTEVADGMDDQQLKAWWYFTPNAGHTVIYSFKALRILARKYGFFYFFYPSRGMHFFVRIPWLAWFDFVGLEYGAYRVLGALKKLL